MMSKFAWFFISWAPGWRRSFRRDEAADYCEDGFQCFCCRIGLEPENFESGSAEQHHRAFRPEDQGAGEFFVDFVESEKSFLWVAALRARES